MSLPNVLLLVFLSAALPAQSLPISTLQLDSINKRDCTYESYGYENCSKGLPSNTIAIIVILCVGAPLSLAAGIWRMKRRSAPNKKEAQAEVERILEQRKRAREASGENGGNGNGNDNKNPDWVFNGVPRTELDGGRNAEVRREVEGVPVAELRADGVPAEMEAREKLSPSELDAGEAGWELDGRSTERRLDRAATRRTFGPARQATNQSKRGSVPIELVMSRGGQEGAASKRESVAVLGAPEVMSGDPRERNARNLWGLLGQKDVAQSADSSHLPTTYMHAPSPPPPAVSRSEAPRYM